MSLMVEDLMHYSAYPEKSNNINLVQTHISLVFIGDEFVYKIKKPVNFGFLDFSSIDKRKYYCNREVELNSRFSKDVYLGVYPIMFDGKNYKINGKGKIVDYAVKMRRLSDDDLFKTRFKEDIVTTGDIKRISKAIADFHNNSKRSEEIDKYGTLESVKFNTDENFQQTEEFIDISIKKEKFDGIKNWTDSFYNNNKVLFNRRVKDGKIRDCHGDLHMEHICLTNPIIIFDCIEFNDRFRYSDILSDIAFLLMDLEFNNGFEFSKQLCKTYLEYIGEKDNDEINNLIKFYKIYRAYVRGKVSSFIINDPNVSNDKKEIYKKTARRYFSLAYSYVSK